MLTLLTVLALAQVPQVSGIRLSFVEKIYIEELGSDYAARYVRDQLTGAFLNRTRGIMIVTNREQADAVLIGNANIRDGYQTWAIGSHQSGSSAAAVAVSTPNGAAAAAVATSQSSTRIQSGGGTIRVTELGLQLVSSDGRILWAYDPTRCSSTTSLILVGIPKISPATVCAVQQLARAMDKDDKAFRHEKRGR